MSESVAIETLGEGNLKHIHTIATWYNTEWKAPVETTINKLSRQKENNILFQLTLTMNGVLAATGGLYHQPNLLLVYPELQTKYGPWVATLYTDPAFRNKGLGATLLSHIEKKGKEAGYNQLYLYTFTAERLYKRNGWQALETLDYKGHETVVMKKEV
jgi:GNAT superfamily N-acetyltransferase